jgi:DNA-binding CsgD family transcriptional regulator
MEASLRVPTYRNLQRLFDEVGALYQPVGLERLATHFTDVLRRLIPGDFYGVSVVIRPTRERDPGTRQTTMSPVSSDWGTLAETFANQYPKFPLRKIRESGDLHRPLALSDVASRAQVERLDLFHDYYRALGVADDLSVNFGNLSHRVCLAVLRGRRGFSEQDRAILAAIRPHMERAYRYARACKRIKKWPSLGQQVVNHPATSNYALGDLGGNPRALSVLGLSEREAEVLYWVAAGKSGPVISTILGIRHDTVRSHLKKIFAKLGVENRLSAALRAHQVLREKEYKEFGVGDKTDYKQESRREPVPAHRVRTQTPCTTRTP